MMEPDQKRVFEATDGKLVFAGRNVHHCVNRRSDPTKMKEATGWEPEISSRKEFSACGSYRGRRSLIDERRYSVARHVRPSRSRVAAQISAL